MNVSHALFWTLWILSCFGQYLGPDLQFPELTNGTVGERVVFTPDKPPSTSINQIQWQFGTTLILSGPPDSVTIFSAYRDRVSFNRDTLGLELQNLRLDDSGTYSLTVIPNAGAPLRGETSLQVFVNVSDVRLTGPEETLIEGKSSANITSEGNGDITSVQWMKDNSPLSPSDSIIFSSDNRSVSISPVQRSDSGEYQCTYKNPVSSETAKVILIINYGPDDVSIKGPDVVDLGVQAFLSCSAVSVPSASFSWTFNDTDTGVTTDTFTIDETEVTHSGDYNCTAYNSVTNRTASQRHALLVKGGGGGGGGLSTGAIAGIVIGVLVIVAGICGLIVYLIKTKKIQISNRQQKGQAKGAAQNRQKPEIVNIEKTRGDGKMSESHIYENLDTKDKVYENVKLGVSKESRDPPQVKK